MNARPRLLFAALLATAVGCGARSGAGDDSTAAPRSPAEAGLNRVLAASDIDGKRLAGSDQSVATVVVVFASWCDPCRRELAILGQLRQSRPDLHVIGLNAYEEFSDFSDEQRLRRFLAANAPWLQVVRDDGTMLGVFGGVPKIPTLFVYDRSGRVVSEFRRNEREPPTSSELEQAIERALVR